MANDRKHDSSLGRAHSLIGHRAILLGGLRSQQRRGMSRVIAETVHDGSKPADEPTPTNALTGVWPQGVGQARDRQSRKELLRYQRLGSLALNCFDTVPPEDVSASFQHPQHLASQ